ncbi:MAG: hypothetical protein HQ582_13160 [Planctomycetes bacterium]|nr:hypothetical protein [Planctomycetota bacterium]
MLKRIILSRWLAGLLLLAGTGAVMGSTGGYCYREELLRIEQLPQNREQLSLDIHRREKTINQTVFSIALPVLGLACASLVLGGRCRKSLRQEHRCARQDPSETEAAVTRGAPAEPKPRPGKGLLWLGLVLLFIGLVVAAAGAGGALAYASRMQRFSCEKVRQDTEEAGSEPEIAEVFYTGQNDVSFTYAGLLKDEWGKKSSLREAEALWDSLGRKHKAIGGRQLALQMTAEQARSREAWDYGAGRSRRQRRTSIDHSFRELSIKLERYLLADVLEGAFRQDQYRPRYTTFFTLTLAGGVVILAALAVLFLRGRRV